MIWVAIICSLVLLLLNIYLLILIIYHYNYNLVEIVSSVWKSFKDNTESLHILRTKFPLLLTSSISVVRVYEIILLPYCYLKFTLYSDFLSFYIMCFFCFRISITIPITFSHHVSLGPPLALVVSQISLNVSP